MAVPCSSLRYVPATFMNIPTSKAVENIISQQIQTRPSALTLKPRSHVESATSRSLRTCWCSFLFLASPPRHPMEGEWLPLLTSRSSANLEGHAPTPGPGTEEPQCPEEGSAGEGRPGGLLPALLCCLFPLLVGRGLVGSKLWGYSP